MSEHRCLYKYPFHCQSLAIELYTVSIFINLKACPCMHGCGFSDRRIASRIVCKDCYSCLYTLYTVKKGYQFSRPQPGCHKPNTTTNQGEFG